MFLRGHIALTAMTFLASGRGTTGSTPFTAMKQTQTLRFFASRRRLAEEDNLIHTTDDAGYDVWTVESMSDVEPGDIIMRTDDHTMVMGEDCIQVMEEARPAILKKLRQLMDTTGSTAEGTDTPEVDGTETPEVDGTETPEATTETDAAATDDVTLLADDGTLVTLSGDAAAEELLDVTVDTEVTATEETLVEALKEHYGVENWSRELTIKEADYYYWNKLIDNANIEGEVELIDIANTNGGVLETGNGKLWDFQTLQGNFDLIANRYSAFSPELYQNVSDYRAANPDIYPLDDTEYNRLMEEYLDAVLDDMSAKLIEDGSFAEDEVATKMTNLRDILSTDTILSPGEQTLLQEMSQNIYGTEVSFSGYEELGLELAEWESITEEMHSIAPDIPYNNWFFNEAEGLAHGWWLLIGVGGAVVLVICIWMLVRGCKSPTD